MWYITKKYNSPNYRLSHKIAIMSLGYLLGIFWDIKQYRRSKAWDWLKAFESCYFCQLRWRQPKISPTSIPSQEPPLSSIRVLKCFCTSCSNIDKSFGTRETAAALQWFITYCSSATTSSTSPEILECRGEKPAHNDCVHKFTKMDFSF